ncbi:peptide/nickel transport system ATP-binding protein [Azospirillum agricola]|uniref:ABC transporter ATP-binding protein n=1 Tax=Azospirillum agricola TaxID=1720247 RepID=UPI001AEB5EFB|nr:ABC transporter ATP-binding protein [Azospirillum agricola]MBP2231855.1 peptide/nickel transport system ATP-binding protein [Azospirillum agricola]
MDPLLSVRDLSIGFRNGAGGHWWPVRGFDLTVEAGETVALVGESGSGKSLTALALMGLLPRSARVEAAGIRFAGQELTGLPERAKRRLRGRDLAMIFQEPMTSLNPVLTIGRQIAEVLRLHQGLSAKAARAQAIELLDLVRIPEPQRRVDDHPHRLSGGMRQRAMIAMAVACRPKLLIADEPTTALDVTIQAQVLELLDRLRRELSLALLLITHDLGVVAQWADRVVVLYAGRKVEEADAGPLFSDPLHPYTRGLLAASPRMNAGRHYRDGPLDEIPGSIASAAGQAGCPFVPRCPAAVAACAEAMPPLLVPAARRAVACPVAVGLPLPGSPLNSPSAASPEFHP